MVKEDFEKVQKDLNEKDKELKDVKKQMEGEMLTIEEHEQIIN